MSYNCLFSCRCYLLKADLGRGVRGGRLWSRRQDGKLPVMLSRLEAFSSKLSHTMISFSHNLWLSCLNLEVFPDHMNWKLVSFLWFHSFIPKTYSKAPTVFIIVWEYKLEYVSPFSLVSYCRGVEMFVRDLWPNAITKRPEDNFWGESGDFDLSFTWYLFICLCNLLLTHP